VRHIPFGVWLFGLFLALLVALPYVVAWLSAPEGWVYSGAPLLPTGIQWDYNSYMSRMWHGWRGQWDYHLLFTHEPHAGILLVNGFYMILGALAAALHLSLPLMYHLARCLLTLCMVVALWFWASHFFETSAERWLCLLFATIVGGWSWLLLWIVPDLTAQISPIEFWMTDAFNSSGALYITHFVAAIILQIVIMLSFDTWIRQGGNWRLIVLAAALAAESIIQPYVIILLGSLLVILAVYHVLVTHRLTLRKACLLAPPLVVHAGLTVYQYLAMRADPVWAKFITQNITLSPPPSFYLLGYLPFLIPIALAVPTCIRGARWQLPFLWAGLTVMLLYAPLSVQRRYLIGVQTPLAALASLGWSRVILPRLRSPHRPLATIAYMALGAIAPTLLIVANSAAAAQPLKNTDVYYRPDERAAYAWLCKAADPEALVLTTFEHGRGSGGRLVAATGQRVFTGHGFETIDPQDKAAQVKRFYDSSTSDAWRRDFLKQIGAVYVWYDDYARKTGSWNPARADYLQLAFASDTVEIYLVHLER